MIKRFIIITTLLLLSFSTYAEIVILPSDQEVNVEEYGNANAKHLMLWMHSEYGISKELQKTLLNISKKQDIQIHMPDWLDSYYLSPSRKSLEKIPQQDFEDLISHYTDKLSKPTDKLFIVASGRVSGMVLNAAHHLQTQGNDSLGGIILISPYLQTGTPEMGKPLSYQQITTYSNLPLYMFQPERSPRFVPHPQLVKALQKGGSPVYTHILANVSGGFHARDEEDLTDADLNEKLKFPKQISNALSVLQQTQAAPLKALQAYKKHILKRKPYSLQKITMNTAKLTLKDIQGKQHQLSDYKGKTVLVSFWASWCGPCIKEMPSLVKLQQKYKDKLIILAVNVREDVATIKKFTDKMNINFALLQDLDSSATKDWKVYVYPSNYIVDSKGQTRYAATGALDWQDSDIEQVLEELME